MGGKEKDRQGETWRDEERGGKLVGGGNLWAGEVLMYVMVKAHTPNTAHNNSSRIVCFEFFLVLINRPLHTAVGFPIKSTKGHRSSFAQVGI